MNGNRLYHTKEELALLEDPFCDDFGGQMDKKLRSKIVKTKKPHGCSLCDSTIVSGSKARNDTWIFDGEIKTYYWHIDCLLYSLEKQLD